MRKQVPINQKKPAAKQGRLGTADGVKVPRGAGSFWSTTGRELFGIDPRSLAVFRMTMGGLILVDLAIRAMDLSAMYTDGGMFPRAEICRRAASIWNWSFHFGGGSWGFQAALFVLAASLAVALLAGFETRLAVIGSWLMLVSLHHRVPPILSGAENLLRMLLFWAMFLPLARVWSVDEWLLRRRGLGMASSGESKVLSVASAAILLQMAMMYFFSAIAKSNADWTSGRAIAGSLAHGFYASPLGAHLLQFPRLLSGMTWGTLAMEWLAPLMLFCPWGTARVRLAFIVALAAMHFGIGICLEVGLFSYAATAGLLLFLPARFWNSRLLARFSSTPSVGRPPSCTGRATAEKHSAVFYAVQTLCLILLIYVVALNINNSPRRPLAPLSPERWRPLSRGLGLAQLWSMFGAIPSKDGWYVARAKLGDGSEVDLLRRGEPVDWTRPEFPARLYPNHFWQKLFREMAYDDEQGFQLMRAPVAEYLCREWNGRQPPGRRVIEFEFIYCIADTTAAGELAPSQNPRNLRERLVHLDLSDR